jgi:(R,R)-butanediol dehydrogenase / meso-butanediol dehydrogenase / diacetyl reductase
MQVPCVYGIYDLRFREIDLPHAGAGDVVLQVACAGICGSDIAYVAAGGVTGPALSPIPLGHELSGIVVEKGEAVTSFNLGDRVILNPLVNLVGNGGSEGGFAERLLVRNVANRPDSLLRLPASVSLEVGALVEPLAVAAHAVNRLQLRGGDKVAIFGAGPIGLAAVIMLCHRGCEDMVVFEPSSFRRQRAALLGARHVIDPLQESPAQALQRLHGTVRHFSSSYPATTHFLEASGAPIIPEIVAMARGQATICVVSGQKQPVPVDFQKVLAKELTLTAALGYPQELSDVLAMLGSNSSINLEPYVSHRFPGTEFLQAFATARQADRAAKVLLRYSG